MRRSLVGAAGVFACLILVSLAGMWLAPRAASGQRDSQPGAASAGDASAFQSLLGQRRPVTLSEVLPGIHVATGNGSSFRIDTPDGAVIIDTGLVTHAARMRELLLGVSDQPVKYLILTHAHADHVGGAPLWIADGVPVIAGRYFRLRHLEHNRLGRYRGRRAAALWSNVMAGWGSRGTPAGQPRRLRDLPVIEPYVIEPDIVVDDSYTFTLGGVRFEVIWLNGAEGPDANRRVAAGAQDHLHRRRVRPELVPQPLHAARREPARRIRDGGGHRPRARARARGAAHRPPWPVPVPASWSQRGAGRPGGHTRNAHAHARRNPLRARRHRRRHERGARTCGR